MPFTPFHFGPGALLHAIAPRHVSFIAFCGANVLIDIETLVNLVQRRDPLHAFFHTFVGATLVVPATLLVFLAARWFAAKVWLPDLFHWRALTVRQVLVGAALGAYTHVVLDSIMHSDARPLMPLSPSNPVFGIVPTGVLHLACFGAGVIAAFIVEYARHPRRRGPQE